MPDQTSLFDPTASYEPPGPLVDYLSGFLNALYGVGGRGKAKEEAELRSIAVDALRRAHDRVAISA